MLLVAKNIAKKQHIMEPIPQPPGGFLAGNLLQVDFNTPMQSFMELAKEYGPIYLLDLKVDKLVIVSSQELVNELCDDKRFSKIIGRALTLVRDYTGDGLFTASSNEPNWAIAHRILMPAFGPKAIQDMFDQMYDVAEQMCLKWERLGGTNVIDIVDNTTRLTLDTLALCAFNYRFNSFYHSDMHPFVNAMNEALSESRSKIGKPWIIDKMMIGTNRRYRANIDTMHSLADDLIRERKMHPNDVNDLMNRMLKGVDPITGQGLSDENIRYQLVTFLIAGHETTSGLLSFTLYELIKNPDCLKRAQQEVDEVIGSDRINIKHLQKLVYLDQVLKEALRLWPTAPAFSVSSKKDEVIGGKYLIKPEYTVTILLPMLHRDPKVWGDDVEKFNPDRVHPESFASLPKNSWKPFGNASRACIGRPFAWQEALLVLAMILQRFDIVDHIPDYTMKLSESLTIKPEGFFLRMNTRPGWLKNKKKYATAQPLSDYNEGSQDESSTELPAKNGPLLVLFGSNSGTCEALANNLYDGALRRGYQATIAHLNEYSGQLPLYTPVMIVTASYEGQPTDDAEQFVSWIDSVPKNALKGVMYAVFGCGHTDWIDTYQRIPTLIDMRMEEAGATKLAERGEGNAAQDIFYEFGVWSKNLWMKLVPDPNYVPVPKSSLKVNVINGTRDVVLRLQNLQSGEIIENRELVSHSHLIEDGVSRSKRHIEIRLPSQMQYREGDYLAILPVNSMKTVNKALHQFNLKHDDQVLIQKSGTQISFPIEKPICAVELFMNYLELSQPASKNQIQVLVEATQSNSEKEELLDLLNRDKLSTPPILDILQEFKSCNISLSTFLELSTPMRVRQYSISSSPLWASDRCTITVGILNAPAKFGNSRQYEGVASNFLAHCLPGSKISVMVRSSSFKLPEDSSTPIIMIAAGTGISPFRGFIQRRALLKLQGGNNIGEALLFQGCRHPDGDYLYRSELEEWSKLGVVYLRPVFSRSDDNKGVKYVQHRLWECRDEVASLLARDAYIYVCGEGSEMAPAVRRVLIAIYREATNCTQEEAEKRMSTMDNRYSVDVFA